MNRGTNNIFFIISHFNDGVLHPGVSDGPALLFGNSYVALNPKVDMESNADLNNFNGIVTLGGKQTTWEKKKLGKTFQSK